MIDSATLLANIELLWLISGAAFIIFEITSVPGVGFLFSGLACLCVGIAIRLGYILPADYLTQFSTFFIATGIWAVLLWRPLKKLINRSRGVKGFTDIIGGSATVLAPGIASGRTGQVKWSGTTMRARLDSRSPAGNLAAGSEVEITDIDGNVLIVLPRATIH